MIILISTENHGIIDSDQSLISFSIFNFHARYNFHHDLYLIIYKE